MVFASSALMVFLFFSRFHILLDSLFQLLYALGLISPEVAYWQDNTNCCLDSIVASLGMSE